MRTGRAPGVRLWGGSTSEEMFVSASSGVSGAELIAG
jgi:hypothetical protein